MESERRTSIRQPATVAVEIDGQQRKGRLGITRDASRTGMLMATPSRFEIGEEFSLTLYLGNNTERVRGRVRRIETTSPRSNEMWRYRLAVEFVEPLEVPVSVLPC